MVDREALTHFDGDMAGAQALVALAQHKAGAVEEDGEEGKPQALREVERPLVETQDFAVGGARAFGENHHRIAACHKSLQASSVLFDVVGRGQKLGIANGQRVEGIEPHPPLGEDDEPRREEHDAQQVEVALVVADDDGGPLKGFAPRVEDAVAHSWEQAQQPAAHALNAAMVGQALLFAHPVALEEEEQPHLHHEHHDEQKEQHSKARQHLQTAPRPHGSKGRGGEGGVEEGDAGKVGRGAKVAHPLFARWIVDPDGQNVEAHIVPSSEDEQLEFGLVAGGEPPQAVQSVEGIGAEARLGVGERLARLDAKPEIAQPIGKLAAGVHVGGVLFGEVRRRKTVAHDDGSGMAADGGEKCRKVVGAVLAIAVEGDGVGETAIHGAAETGH